VTYFHVTKSQMVNLPNCRPRQIVELISYRPHKMSNILQNVELIGLFFFSDKHPLGRIDFESSSSQISCLVRPKA
jgi:hypothetical protein